MNAVLVRGHMNQVRGEFRSQWCRMTGNDLGRINGQILKMVGRAQTTYARALARVGKRLRRVTGR